VADVRETMAAARTAIDAYRAGGGKPGAANHPALSWHEALWAYRERNPDSDAAALATAEAIQLLIRAELWDKARARVDAVGVNDRAWERLSAYLYYDASARKDYGRATETFSKVADGTRIASIKAAALLSLGRVQRRQGDTAAAVKSLESARAAAPDAASAAEAGELLYDIANLSIGLQAPAFSATSIDGRAIGLDSLRGRAVAIVFWAST
jgi:tetratricopeptide (TPR) repeat protein